MTHLVPEVKLNVKVDEYTSGIGGNRSSQVSTTLRRAYIYKKFGFSKIKIIGSVRGKEKTAKGTPDTLFQESEEKGVFTEYTTQKSGLLGKFLICHTPFVHHIRLDLKSFRQ